MLDGALRKPRRSILDVIQAHRGRRQQDGPWIVTETALNSVASGLSRCRSQKFKAQREGGQHYTDCSDIRTMTLRTTSSSRGEVKKRVFTVACAAEQFDVFNDPMSAVEQNKREDFMLQSTELESRKVTCQFRRGQRCALPDAIAERLARHLIIPPIVQCRRARRWMRWRGSSFK